MASIIPLILPIRPAWPRFTGGFIPNPFPFFHRPPFTEYVQVIGIETDKNVVINQWQSQIETWEEQIRSGHGGQVRLALLQLKRNEIPREHLCKVVNLARRTRLERWGMKLLFPFVRGEKSNLGASAQEICEYSSALMELGSLDEARELLLTVDPAKEPKALL